MGVPNNELTTADDGAEVGQAERGLSRVDGRRNVLVISTVEHSAEALRAAIAPGDTIKVVVPVIRQGILDWLANDERAFGHAQEVALETAAELPGVTADAVAGEADLDLAVRDALATFPADEIVVAVHDADHQGTVEAMAVEGSTATSRRSIDGVPLRFVVIAKG